MLREKSDRVQDVPIIRFASKNLQRVSHGGSYKNAHQQKNGNWKLCQQKIGLSSKNNNCVLRLKKQKKKSVLRVQW